VNATDFDKDGDTDILLTATTPAAASAPAYKNVNNGASWTSSSTGLNTSDDFLDVSYGTSTATAT